MEFGQKIERIVNRLVLPEFKDIDFVTHKRHGIVDEKYFYEFMFVIKKGRYEDVDSKMMKDIMEATDTVIDVVGLPKGCDYSMFFRSGKNYNKSDDVYTFTIK